MALVDSIAKVKRGNVILKVSTDEVDRYIAKGYDLVDESGKVLKASVPNNVDTLKIAFEKHTARIKELEEQVAELEKQLKAAKTTTTKKAVSKKDAE